MSDHNLNKIHAEILADKLFRNMSDRRGFHTDDLDDETRQNWLSEWTDIILKDLNDILKELDV